MENLWPAFDNIEKTITPKAILIEQARALSAQFNKQIEGSITEQRFGEAIICTFRIKCNPLDYIYELFKIKYEIFDIYPIFIILEGDLAKEFGDIDGDLTLTCNEQKEFMDTLRLIFSSKKTQKIIRGLKQHLS
jgi:hypothetical protein